ncbi:hypothetical protein QYE76_001389 [Lolium multiflorum]|uniref:CCHC-type domain-containing protein n=1 Tax=Lolium multiflorum TaxID=4521 RepID=A0AAD8RL37_LOLMU|nr:hypothetical protein QYE76_001389 [Lolium multiflorum]
MRMKMLSFKMKRVVLVVVLDVVTVVVALLNSELAVSLHNRKTMVWNLMVMHCVGGMELHVLVKKMNELPVLTWREMKAIMQAHFVPTNYLRSIYDKLTLLRQCVMIVDAYYMEMEMLMQRGRVRESLEMTMQCFLHGLKYDIKGIVRYQSYTTMNQLLHHAREAEAQLADEAQIKGHATGAGCYTPRAPASTAPAPSSRPAPFPTSSSKPVSNVSNTKKPEPAASTSGSSMSTARNRDMNCHTCGGKGHFKRDCPNRKVMIINDNDEYETGDDADPYAPEDDDYDSDGVDAFPSEARTIVVSQRALNVQPSASTQRCNLFQTKALVGPDKACKVIIDGGSCRNLASKELCAKLKLKYLPHPHPYYIQWLSDNGEMKVNHMVRVDFEIGPYKDSIDFDVVPMMVCHLLLGRPWLYDRSVQHNGRANTYHLEFKGKKINLQPMSPQQIVNESRQKVEVNLEDAPIDRRENCNVVSDITKSERVNSLVLLATKEDMREFSEDPTAMPLVLMYKGEVLVSNDMTPISLGVSNVLQEFSDVFPEEVPAGLPPLRGIEHQIDLIPGASLPNRAPYRTNPEETKEIQKQVQALLDKENLRHRELRRIDRAASAGRRNTREKRALRRAGNSLPEGEIDAIAIVIELDIISIIITIIFIIITAISTAASRHRYKTLLDTACSGSFTRNKEEFKWDLLDRIQENTEGWENDKGRVSVVANIYKAFASHFELPRKNFDKYHEPYKDKVDSPKGKCIEIKTVDHVLPEAYIEKTPFPAKMKEYSVITSVVNKSAKKPIEPEEQIKVEPAVAIVKDLVTENVEDGHIIFCEDASNIVSHPNKSRKASVPVLSVRIGDHCYYGLCDIGASISAIPYELYTEIMHEIGSCELEDIDVVIRLANRETISPIGIVRDVEVLCGKIKYPADFLVLGSAASKSCPIIFGRPFLNTCGAIIDCKKEKIVTKFSGESYEFNFSKFAKTPYKADLPNDDFRVEQCASIALAPSNPLQQHLENSESEVFREERDELDEIFLRQPILKHDLPVEDLGVTPPPKEDHVFDLKPLPDNLKYAYIDDKKTYPVIISAKLSDIEEERLLRYSWMIFLSMGILLIIACETLIKFCRDVKKLTLFLIGRNATLWLMKELYWDIKFERGIEVDRAKVEAIEKMPYPRDVKGIRSILGHAGFYRRFIKDFSKISKPLTNLLQKDVPFIFDDDCKEAFETLKKALTTAPVVEPPDWNLPFEIMCDASDFAVGVVLGQRVDKKLNVIHYANRKGANNPVADNLSRLENITYDPVPVNDSFPNEQLAVIKVSSRDSPCTMVSNNKDKGPLEEDIQDPELKEEVESEDEEEVEEIPRVHPRATIASIGVISNPSNTKRSARIATGGAVPRRFLAPRTSSPGNYHPFRNLICNRQTERTPKVVLPSGWDIDRSNIAGEMKPEAEGWGNNSKSWDSPSDMLMSRVEHNSELIRNLTYEIEDLKELVKKLVEKNPPSSPPKE